MISFRRALFVFILITAVLPLHGQNYNPPFPRTVFQSPYGTAGGAAAYFYSRYDLAVHGLRNEWAQAFNDSIRALNPDILIFGTCEQGVWPNSNIPPSMFIYCASYYTLTDTARPGDSQMKVFHVNNYGHPVRPGNVYALVGENDWITYTTVDSNTFYGIPTSGYWALDYAHPPGDSIKFANRMSGFGMIHNLTPYAPLADGKETWRWFIDYRFARQDFSLFDGIFYDAFRVRFWLDDFERQGGAGIDLNYNRISDFDEHGYELAGLQWVNTQWQGGVEKMLQYEHDQFAALHPAGKPSIITVNTGAAEDNYAMDVCEGMLWEGFMRFATDWQTTMNVNRQWDQRMQQRGMTNFTMIIDYEKEGRATYGKNVFNRMRYGLTTALLSGCFYGRTFGDYYYITYYHDEFDTDLGYPTSEPQELPSGAWVRFFTKGAAICNPTGQPITVDAGELTSMTGYDGPYYRFRGGQDPDFNNGQLFTSVDLYGETRSRPKDNQGDGILLFKDSVTVVADIWIGNTFNNDTSPGNEPVELAGDWVEVTDWSDDRIHPWGIGNPCFSQWNQEYTNGSAINDGIGYAYAPGGDGSSTATFRPNIGVAGYYEIAEWHGILNSPGQYETPAELWVDGQRKMYLSIDQKNNRGRWNRLAVAWLPKGNTSFLRINNKAPSYVLADAVRFRYLGDVTPDSLAPAKPQNMGTTRN